ncbi:MAG: peptidylprolyl isomerase [Bacteroidia bacterium]|nr:peptidylprolyl isomerase [Bacteroidia bacterium]
MAGIINKIRDKGPLLLIVVGAAMLLFILTDIITHINNIITGGGEARTTIGEIAGEKIPYKFFEARVRYAEYKQKQNNPNVEIDDYMRSNLANQTWEQIANEIIFAKEYQKVGIEVPESEYNVMLSDPQILQYFGGSYENVKQAYAQADKNPELKSQLTDLENQLIQQRKQQKYFTLVSSGVIASTAEARRKYKEENEKRSFEFLAINYASVPDAQVKPTEEDFNNYYREHLEEFKQPKKEAIIRYIIFPKTPTAQDSATARNYLEGLKQDFKKATNDSIFAVTRNRSSQRFDFDLKSESQLDSKTAELIAGAQKDSVIGPFLDGAVLKLIKIVERSKNDTQPAIKLRHILIRISGNTPQDTIAALNKATEIKNKVTKDNFVEMVMTHSEDERSKSKQGEIGWYNYGSWGKNFDKEIKKAQKGQILGPIKSNMGFHIVEILDRSNNTIRLATIGYDITAGDATKDALRKKADMFLLDVKDSVAFNKKAAAMKLNVMDSPPISAGMVFFPGIQGSAIREIIRLSMEKKPGTVYPQSIEADNAFVVFYVRTHYEEGYKPLEAVKPLIANRVKDKLKAKIILEKLNKIKANNLEAIKNSYGPGPFISTAENVTFSSGSIPGVGNDPILLGTVFSLKPNQISKPIEGTTGIYIVKVTSIEEANPTEQQLAEYRSRLSQEKRQRFQQAVYQGLKELAQIKDYRYNFGY